MNGYGNQREIVLIGMGNVLMQDEGVGVRAVERLEALYELPDDVLVLDGGTTGTELLEPMRGVRHLLVADAVNTGDPCGSLTLIRDEQVPAFFQTKLSNHQLGLSDLLGLLRLSGEQPQQVTIIGMVPHYLENRLGLSPEAETGLDTMVGLIADELRELGVELKRRSHPRKGYWERQAEHEAMKCA